MSILDSLPAANAAPMVDRSSLRRPALILANAVLGLLAVAALALALSGADEIKHIALYTMAPVIAMTVAWPSMQAFGLDRERLLIKATGADAFILSQIIGLVSMHTVHETMHGSNPIFLVQILMIPAIAALVRNVLDRRMDAKGFQVELDDGIPA